jgi:multidrug efflux pump subunit AcrB
MMPEAEASYKQKNRTEGQAMIARLCWIVAAFGALFAASQRPDASAASEPAVGQVVTVTASYPGASAQEVAATVAAPIEQQIQGAEGVVRIESESRNDGTYVARLSLAPKADPNSVVQLIQKRVALATGALPVVVSIPGVAVKVAGAAGDRKRVTVALIDRGSHGWDALKQWAGAVRKRLAADGAVVKPELFPVDEKQLNVRIDREKCARLGLRVIDVARAVQEVGPGATIDRLKKATVGRKIPLTTVTVIEEVTGPGAVYRVDLHPAVRITGTPAEGKSVAAAASRCVELAEAEGKRIGAKGFVVENLSANQVAAP